MLRFACGVLIGCAFVGCQSPSARFVKKAPDEGTIAIPFDNEQNRAKAHEMMKEHFPDGYEITWEEEAKIGSSTVLNESTRMRRTPPIAPSANAMAEWDVARQAAMNREMDRNQSVVPTNMNVGLDPVGPGMTTNSAGSIQTVDRTEWRINYRRKRGGQGELTRAPPEITQGVRHADAEEDAP